jgi:hypothetical protein
LVAVLDPAAVTLACDVQVAPYAYILLALQCRLNDM